jgi:glycosyltransferase involved in cell wall biosynthesis
MSQPLKVLLACHRFPPDAVAGVERITQSLGVELTKRGDEVSIVTRRAGPMSTVINSPRILRGWLPDGSRLYRLTGNLEHPQHFMLHDDRMSRHLSTILAETVPDVVHILHLMHLSPQLIPLALRQRAAVVVSLQDYYFACQRVQLSKPTGELCDGPDHGRACAQTCFGPATPDSILRWGLRTDYLRQLLLLANRVICPSQYVATFFERQGLPRQRIRVIPNAVATPRADPPTVSTYTTPRQRGHLRIAVLGTIAPHKGQHVILQALEIAELAKVTLYVFGPTHDFVEYIDEFKEQADAIPGLEVSLYGRYEPGDLPILLHDMDCVIAPSVWPETFCIVSREALARGIPALVSNLGALPEAIVDGVNGYTFNPLQPEELARHLQQLSEDESLLVALRKGALATNVMSQREHADAVRDVYQEALADHRQNGLPESGAFEKIDLLRTQLLDAGFAAPDFGVTTTPVKSAGN